MANKEPVSLQNWASGRPVKLNEREVEQAYTSRQERTRVGLRLRNENAAALRLWAATNRRDQQDLVDELLASYFGLVAQTPTDHDDLINDDDGKERIECPSSSLSIGRPGDLMPAADVQQLPATAREVLTFYQLWTGNKARRRDGPALAEVLHLPKHVIMIGIGVSVFRKKGRINSLKYCLGAIAETAESGVGPEYLDYVTRQLRQRAKQPILPGVGGDLKELRDKQVE